jgi:23S rRNA G2445 N2-methylase RlmL
MPAKKQPVVREKRHDRLSIIDADGGFLIYNAPFGDRIKPTVVATVEDLAEYVRDWAEDMITQEDE